MKKLKEFSDFDLQSCDRHTGSSLYIHKNKIDWTCNCHVPAMALSSKSGIGFNIALHFSILLQRMGRSLTIRRSCLIDNGLISTYPAKKLLNKHFRVFLMLRRLRHDTYQLNTDHVNNFSRRK